MKSKPTVVSIFSGAGCFDYGFEAAGFETLLTTDFDLDACSTISISRPKWQNLHIDIKDLSKRAIFEATSLKKFETDVLIGGPPCQPFSKSSYGTLKNQSALKDPRGHLVKEYMRVLGDLCPKVFIIENVPQFISGSNKITLKILNREIEKINFLNGTDYKLSIQSINTAHYGVPQTRNRLFIVGERNGRAFKWPEINFMPKADIDFGIQSYITAGDALKGVVHTKNELSQLNFGGRYSPLLKTIPPGKNYLWHSEENGRNSFKARTRFWNFLLKLSPNLPSWTITAQPGMNIGPFHWDSRRLSDREVARLQTIPDDVEFFGSRIDSPRKQIGNGVPSLIGEILGHEIKQQFLGWKKTEYNLKLIHAKSNLKSPREHDL